MEIFNPEIKKQFQEALKKPTGTFSFKYTSSHDLFDLNTPSGIIFEVASGVNYVRLEKEISPKISFYHSTPGIGTRVATVDLKLVKPSKTVHFIFSWSIEEIILYVGSIVEDGNLVCAKGDRSEKNFRIDKYGEVVQIGDTGLQVMDARINTNGIQLLKPTAIGVWHSTKLAIEVLQTGKSDQGYIFETIKANFTLVMLVTGFESYCKTRLQEIVSEGRIIDFEEMSKKHFSIEDILKPTNNCFQNFDNANNVFRVGLGIKFENFLSTLEIQRIKSIFTFRHRIVHVDPLLTMLNEFKTPNNNPIFSTNIVKTAVSEFNNFIEKIHNKTLC